MSPAQTKLAGVAAPDLDAAAPVDVAGRRLRRRRPAVLEDVAAHRPATHRAGDVAARRLEELELRGGRRGEDGQRGGADDEGDRESLHGAHPIPDPAYATSPASAIPYPFPPLATLGTPENPLRVAIVGSGPAGFYAAEHLLKREDVAVAVDMFDRLPTPFGLVRAGVAPDHPKIKSVIRVYEKTAGREGFRFFGNVDIGPDVTVAELERALPRGPHAYGTSTDRQLGIPGEDLPGSHAATEFVNWYNAHPDFADHEFDLSVKRAVVIGNGNVAADVARMLALPRAELESPTPPITRSRPLVDSGIEEIVVLGRRGPAQAAFTNPEVRELGELTDADIVIDPAEVELDEASRAYVESEDAIRPTAATSRSSPSSPGASRRASPSGSSCASAARRSRSRATAGSRRSWSAATSWSPTSRRISRPRHRRARGDRVRPGAALDRLQGRRARGAAVRRRARRDPERGRPGHDPETGEQVPGHYAVGWIKRGPSGVIGTNKKDAQDTVNSIFEDLETGRIPELEDVAPAIAELLDERGADHITYWAGRRSPRRAAAGEPHGRPRVKFCRVDEMVEAATRGYRRTRPLKE